MLTATMKSLKIVWSLACAMVLASNVWSMSHWNEARGVYDDVCYLRQAISSSVLDWAGSIPILRVMMTAIWRRN